MILTSVPYQFQVSSTEVEKSIGIEAQAKKKKKW
uniref:Uncharacterized protein n=1 Tax=Arundo donax TaxID=35708 RepID=A0A0A9BI53_ARUDO